MQAVRSLQPPSPPNNSNSMKIVSLKILFTGEKFHDKVICFSKNKTLSLYVTGLLAGVPFVVEVIFPFYVSITAKDHWQ
jgi:hypothetical protein